MPFITLNKFGGIMPKRAPRRLGDLQAQTAQNVDLRSGRLVPWKVPGSVTTLPDSDRISIFKWRRNDTYEWLSWTHDADVVKAPVADDQYDRIFYLDADGNLRVKGWNSGESDRSCSIPAPAKISSIGWTDRFTFDTVTGQYCSTTRDETMTYLGLERTDDTFRFKFRLQGYKESASLSSFNCFRIVLSGFNAGVAVSGSAVVGNTAAWPAQASSAQNTAYDRKLLVKTTGGSYIAEMELSAVEDVMDTTDSLIDYSSGGTIHYVYSRDVTFVFKMNFTTTTVQYQYYVTTWVDDWGMESPASSISDQATWNPGQKITLTFGSNAPAGYHITKRRIYRSASGTQEDAFFYVAEIAAATATYDDVLTDAELTEKLPELTNPPSGLQGLIVMPGGFVAAFKNRELYMSPPYIPYSMPTKYQLTFDYDIVAIAPSGNDIVVLTKANPYYVTGSHPELMTQSRLEIPQACESKRSVCHVGNLVLYASPDGIVGIEGGAARLVSEPYYNREQWQALAPSSMVGEVHDNVLFLVGTQTFLILDLVNGFLTTTDQTATELYADLEDDLLYMVQSAAITSWNQGSTNMTLTWKSKEFQLKRPFEWNTGRVFGDSYTGCYFKLYAENTLVTTVTVQDKKAFRTPLRRPERVWELEVINDDAVTEISISMAMEWLR